MGLVAMGALFSGAFAYGYIIQWVFCLRVYDLSVVGLLLMGVLSGGVLVYGCSIDFY